MCFFYTVPLFLTTVNLYHKKTPFQIAGLVYLSSWKGVFLIYSFFYYLWLNFPASIS